MVDVVVGRETFSSKIAKELGCRYREFRHEYYQDGEPKHIIHAEYEEIEGKDVVLVLRGSQLPEYTRVSRNLHNFSRHINNLKNMFRAKSVDILMPYYWLSRQDKDPRTHPDRDVKERDKGRDIGYEWLARDFKVQGADRIITFNSHFNRKDREIDVCGLPVISLSGGPALTRYINELIENESISNDFLLVGTDERDEYLIKECSMALGKEYILLEKHRDSKNKPKTKEPKNVGGRDVVIVDDIFSTLSTLDDTIKSLMDKRDVTCMAVHGVFAPDGHKRAGELIASGIVKRIATTDTIDNDYAKTSVMPEILEFYKSQPQ